MGTYDISNTSLLVLLLLLIVPFVIAHFIGLKIMKETIIAVIRMFVQLLAVGVLLKIVFEKNISIINIIWLVSMLTVASASIVKQNKFKIKYFFIPVFVSMFVSIVSVLLYFNKFVLKLDDIFEARYLIAIGGMLLGNSLRGNIIAVGNFYTYMKKREKEYQYKLAMGAKLSEALMPYIREALTSSLKPTLASISTIGLVFLPGMMTGQLLGGSNPILAIKYQFAIMIGIFTTTFISIVLTMLLTTKIAFNSYGILNKEIFKNGK